MVQLEAATLVKKENQLELILPTQSSSTHLGSLPLRLLRLCPPLCDKNLFFFCLSNPVTLYVLFEFNHVVN